MKTLTVAADVSSVSIAGEQYTPDDKGQIEVPADHVQSAMQLGCTDPDAPAPERVVPTIPDVPADELSKALILENEDLKADNDALRVEVDDLKTEVGRLTERLDAVQGEADELAASLEKALSALEAKVADAPPPEVAADAAEAPSDSSPSAKKK